MAEALVVDVDVVLGQPRRQRDVGAEDDHVVEAEAPDPHLLERLQHRRQRPALPGDDVVAGGHEPGHRGHDEQQDHVEEGHEPPAAGDQAQEARGGTAAIRAGPMNLVTEAPDVASPEDAECEALVSLRPPGADPGDPDAEGVAGQADEERVDEQLDVVVRRGDQVGGDRGRGQHHGQHQSAAAAVGEDAGGQPPDRAVEHGDGGDPGQLDVGEAELLADRDAQHPEHQPHREHQGEADWWRSRAPARRRDASPIRTRGLGCRPRRSSGLLSYFPLHRYVSTV